MIISVGRQDKCSMQPVGTDISTFCIYISIIFDFPLMFVDFRLHVFCKLVLMNYTEGSTISACLSFLCYRAQG